MDNNNEYATYNERNRVIIARLSISHIIFNNEMKKNVRSVLRFFVFFLYSQKPTKLLMGSISKARIIR